MAKEKLLLHCTAILTATVLFSCGTSQKPNSAGKGAKGGNVTYVDALVVKSLPAERTLQLPGTILPNEQVALQAETSGKIVALNLVEGTSVNKGDLLAQINDSDILATLEKKKLDEKLAAEDVARKKKLLDLQALSQQDYDAALNTLEGIRADIALSKAQIAKTEIRAPFSGKVGLRNVSLGSYVSPSTVVATMVQDNPLKVEFDVPERYVQFIRQGIEVKFSLGNSVEQHTAKVYATASALDPDTRTLKVRALFQNPGGKIIPGTYAKVTITFENLPDVISIPPQAIVPEMNKQTVFIAKNGIATKKMVIIGERTGETAEIASGISIGDTLILTGLTSLRNGMPVSINLQN